jgi:hypothetical protein
MPEVRFRAARRIDLDHRLTCAEGETDTGLGSHNDLIRHEFATTPRGPVDVKGKGAMNIWFLESAYADPG